MENFEKRWKDLSDKELDELSKCAKLTCEEDS